MKTVIVFTLVKHHALKTRVKEQAKAIATLDKNSLSAEHQSRDYQGNLRGNLPPLLISYQTPYASQSPNIDLESVKIVDRSWAWRQRLNLEAWHSIWERNALNERIARPNNYNNILKMCKVIKNTLETIVEFLRGVIITHCILGFYVR